MFFSPLIANAVAQAEVVIVSLSNGGFRGLGATRARELVAACRTFGIPSECVTVIDHPLLPDDPAVRWPLEIATAVLVPLLRRGDCVVSFDAGGASGHPNHIAAGRAARAAAAAVGAECLALHTPRWWCAWAGPLAIAPLAARRVARAVLGLPPPPPPPPRGAGPAWVWTAAAAWRAMRRHASQLVWFRALFVCASSLCLRNDFVAPPAVPAAPAPLEG